MADVTLKEIIQNVPAELENHKVILTNDEVVDWTKFTNNLRTYIVVQVTPPPPAPKLIKFVVADTADNFIAVADTAEAAKTIGEGVGVA